MLLKSFHETDSNFQEFDNYSYSFTKPLVIGSVFVVARFQDWFWWQEIRHVMEHLTIGRCQSGRFIDLVQWQRA